MAVQFIRHHSHFGAFQAEVDDGRMVGVRPFERDPDPSPLIEALPEAVYSKTRVMRPMVREGYRPVGKDFPVFLHPVTHEEYALARTERKSGRGYKGFTVHAAPDVTLSRLT